MMSDDWIVVPEASEAEIGDLAIRPHPLETWALREEGWVCRSSILMNREGLSASTPPPGSTIWRELQRAGARDSVEGGTSSGDARLWGMKPQPADARARVLDAARQAVTVDRAATHGDLEDSFGLIAALWSADLGIALTACDVARLMALLKVARAKGNPGHQDNWVDLAGYAACGGALAEGRGDG